jgi:hypothetical protein
MTAVSLPAVEDLREVLEMVREVIAHHLGAGPPRPFTLRRKQRGSANGSVAGLLGKPASRETAPTVLPELGSRAARQPFKPSPSPGGPQYVRFADLGLLTSERRGGSGSCGDGLPGIASTVNWRERWRRDR